MEKEKWSAFNYDHNLLLVEWIGGVYGNVACIKFFEDDEEKIDIVLSYCRAIRDDEMAYLRQHFPEVILDPELVDPAYNPNYNDEEDEDDEDYE